MNGLAIYKFLQEVINDFDFDIERTSKKVFNLYADGDVQATITISRYNEKVYFSTDYYKLDVVNGLGDIFTKTVDELRLCGKADIDNLIEKALADLLERASLFMKRFNS